MPAAENSKGKPGKTSPSIDRVYSPKASAPKLHQPMRVTKKPSRRFSPPGGLCRLFGASPVASALGIRSGATPRELIHSNSLPHRPPSKPDISTLLGLGHFYFALTGALILMSQQSRNVLFWINGKDEQAAPFPSIVIIQNGARRQGFASPRNSRAPLTAPRRSEDGSKTRERGSSTIGLIGHFYFAGIGHFYFAATGALILIDR
jgi:hypothetical protein